MAATDRPEVAQFDALRQIRSGAMSFDDARIYCRACGARQACQLGIVVKRDDDIDGVSGTVTIPLWCEGGPGVVHGGFVLAVLDEVLGTVSTSAGLLAVTARMETTFVRPVPVDTPLAVRAWLAEVTESGRRVTHALLESHQVLATAAGEFVVRDPGRHFIWAHQQNTSP